MPISSAPIPKRNEASLAEESPGGTSNKSEVEVPSNLAGERYQMIDLVQDGVRGDTTSSAHSDEEVDKQRQRQRMLRQSAARLDQLVDMRRMVMSKRVVAREKRTILRNKRDRFLDLEARNEQDLRIFLALPTQIDPEALKRDVNLLSELRGQLRLEEEEYNSIEDDLNTMEWRLVRQEQTFYKNDENIVAGEIEEIVVQTDSGSDDEDAISIASSSSAFSINTIARKPVQRLIQSKSRARDLIWEDLEYLEARRGYLISEKESRSLNGLQLEQEDQHFLDEFDPRFSALEADLSRAELEIDQLLESALEEASVFYLNQFDADQDSQQLFRRQRKLDRPVDDVSRNPLLWAEFEKATVFSDHIGLGTKRDSFVSSVYINAWLLHFLRSSALELFRFKTSDKVKAAHLDAKQLAQLVLQWWFKDADGSSWRPWKSENPRPRSNARATIFSANSVRSDPTIQNLNNNLARLRLHQGPPIQPPPGDRVSMPAQTAYRDAVRPRRTAST